jgi:hypothetical protein
VKMFGGMCVLSWTYNYAFCMWVTVQYVLLSHCLRALCFISCALCYVLINFLCFIYSFLFVFLFCKFCFLFCVFCVFVMFCALFLPLYIIVYFKFVYNFTDHCHRVETQLQLINIISYRIIT